MMTMGPTNRQMLSADAENDITVCAFRLLTMDLLVLYGVMNEGTINVLGNSVLSIDQN